MAFIRRFTYNILRLTRCKAGPVTFLTEKIVLLQFKTLRINCGYALASAPNPCYTTFRNKVGNP